ncbi:hypothetical protein FEM03_20735 [Phragmitibacter flavus]|uniref:Uncharacterized protein n=1 Tax=Phragmitibacter flavus TaxID=2576071 RepID=A0A5R8K8W8_9BACT|nr:hypothetical protein [Phragmitibacter flavus]TLD68763.1 hypothetical protein FEM03_20735 [Phragmitibacter flavus]
MGFFSNLFNPVPDNPTREFPPLTAPLKLVWHTELGQVNRVSPGASVNELVVFGPCDNFLELGEHAFEFTYPELGLILQCSQGSLEFITFMISEDDLDDPEMQVTYARPWIEPIGQLLTPETDARALTAMFGAFEVASEDEEEVIGNFRLGGMVYEASFGADALLKRLMIYLDDARK